MRQEGQKEAGDKAADPAVSFNITVSCTASVPCPRDDPTRHISSPDLC